MIEKLEKLTWRQTEVLLSIYLRLEKFGYATTGDIVSDTGLSIATVKTHLKPLIDKKLVYQPDGKNVNDLNFERKLLLTKHGIINSEHRLTLINALKTESIKKIYEKNLSYSKSLPLSQSRGWECYKNTPSPLSKVFSEIIEQNPVEPFTVSIAMYSELDGQLALFSKQDIVKYKTLSRTNLHMQIRNGRIASIAIPISLRGSISQKELDGILGNSWSWPGITRHSSAQRYLSEVVSLGIAQKYGNILTSLNSTTTDTITWLASKVNLGFQNLITPMPKVALVLFRETFKYPTNEDLFNPQKARPNLDWLNKVHEKMDKSAYKKSIATGIDILLNQSNIIEVYEGRLIPRTILRKIKSIPDIENKFKFLLNRAKEGNTAATILLAVTANPGITLDDLHREMNVTKQVEYNEIESTLTTLLKSGLIYPSHSKYSSSNVCYYSFTQIPYLIDGSSESAKANAILKNIEPNILTKINDLFPDIEEKNKLYDVINKLSIEKSIELESIEKEYDKVFATKMVMLCTSSISPFIKLDDKSYKNIVVEGSSISEIILNVIQFSVQTNNKSIDVYSQALSDMLMRDKKYYKKIGSDAIEFKKDMYNINMKSN